MAAPSNIRINPFIGDGGTTNYVDFTEVHIIPAVSPFVVRLNEVPQKKDPSNMKVVYVDETTGAPTTTALTEVAATPGVSEFRPDYSTNADDDKDWNTGLIEFSSADAGKSVQISYTGMGTLAGVKNNRFPSWCLDRGDGSDGDFRPTGNVTISGLKQYRSVFIPAGVTVTVSEFAKIKCLGGVVCKGTIKSIGKAGGGKGGSGQSGAAGTSAIIASGYGGSGGWGKGGPVGGAGGSASIPLSNIQKTSLLDIMPELFCGSGGGGGGTAGGQSSSGDGGTGGGCIVIFAEEVNVTGVITSAGANGGYGGYNCGGGGGGGGGALLIVANVVTVTGTVSVAGGSGGGFSNTASAGGTGGTGIMKIIELGVL